MRVGLVSTVMLAALAVAYASQQESIAQMKGEPMSGSFAGDLAVLRAHTEIIELTSADGNARVAVAPAYQGRVMTSSASGLQGPSFGYVHRAGVEAGVRTPHMTVLGGEDRFWLGPEGGQYGLYFAPGAPFDFEHWQVPELIDWGVWPVTARSDSAVSFHKDMTLQNRAATELKIGVDRRIRLLDAPAIATTLGVAPEPSVHVVAYASENRITNAGTRNWTKETGLVSIWILGMFKPGKRAVVVIPFVPGPESQRGPIVNDRYFGPIASDRLRITESALFFRGDGESRGKIGVPSRRARDVAGSYDADAKLLTLVKYSFDPAVTDYVNSMWEEQKQPYAGDVVNSYNDGPLGPGKPPLGPFYEIESSSAVRALKPGESLSHVHTTLHLQGDEPALDHIARAVLGVSVSQISAAFEGRTSGR